MMGTGNSERGTGGRVSPRAARPMKPSGIPWLGDVPEGWEIDKIKYWFKATNTRGNTILQLLSATQKYGMYPQSKLEGIVQVAEKTDLNTFKTVHIDDFVISLRSFQGGIERSDYEGVCSPAYQTFHAMREINTGYFKYLFKSHGFIEAINRLTVGIREGKTINYSDVREMGVPFPPLPEQRAIAERIDCEVARVDALREKIKREIERLGDYKKSLIAETVTRGLRKRKMKPSGTPWLGDVPAEWEVTRLQWHIEEVTELNCPVKTDFILSLTNDRGVIPYSEKGNQGNKAKEDISGYKIAFKNSIIANSMNIIIGSVGLSQYYGCVSPVYYVFRAKDSADIRFINYIFQTSIFQRELRKYAKGILEIRLRISASAILKQKIVLPPLPEQREITAYLDRAVSRIDVVVARRKTQLEKLEAFKRSLIQEYVTGKREVCL